MEAVYHQKQKQIISPTYQISDIIKQKGYTMTDINELLNPTVALQPLQQVEKFNEHTKRIISLEDGQKRLEESDAEIIQDIKELSQQVESNKQENNKNFEKVNERLDKGAKKMDALEVKFSTKIDDQSKVIAQIQHSNEQLGDLLRQDMAERHKRDLELLNKENQRLIKEKEDQEEKEKMKEEKKEERKLRFWNDIKVSIVSIVGTSFAGLAVYYLFGVSG